MRKRQKKQTFAARLKEEFDFDVTALDDYVDEQSEDILVELVMGTKLMDRINVMEGVKGSEKIKLMKMDTPLQSAEACGRTPDGDIIFTDKTMTVSAVKIDMSVCNKTLKGTWAQMLLALGKRAEKENLPLEDIIAAFVIKRGHLKNQDLMFKGDTASANPDLVYYDGYIKKWKADSALRTVAFTGGATSVSNAFARYRTFGDDIPEVLLDNGIMPEIIAPRAEAKLVLNNIYNDKDYNAILNVKRDGAEMSFELPTNGVTVRTYPQLRAAVSTGIGTNAGEVYYVPYEFMFFGTDLTGDMDDFWLKYDEIQEKVYFGAEWASGIQYVYPEYFGKMTVSA